MDGSTVASDAAWISEGGGSTKGRLSRVLKYSRHLVTIDAPSKRRLFPSAKRSREDYVHLVQTKVLEFRKRISDLAALKVCLTFESYTFSPLSLVED